MFTEPVELGVNPVDKPVNKMGPDPVEEVNGISDENIIIKHWSKLYILES